MNPNFRARQDSPLPIYQAFPNVFPHPTGKNGYEDLVAASDLLRLSKLYQEAELNPTLTNRRRALADPRVRQARALLDQAFNKPVAPPQRTMDASTTFPEFAGFRSLARLLNHEMHVFFAEGRTSYAINDLALGLKLGRAPKGQVLIGELVGIAIDAIVLTRIAKHLEQLTPHDCDRVIPLLREHRDADLNSGREALEMEAQGYNNILNNLAKNFKALLQELVTEPDPDADPREHALYQRTKRQVEDLENDPNGQRRVIDSLRQAGRVEHARGLAYLQDPSTVPPPSPAYPEGSLEASLAAATLPALPLAIEKFVQDQLNLQLLAVHCAIRKYKWEWEKLPDTLETLRVTDLVLDPYSKQPLRYERKDDTYELYSIGPLRRDEDAPAGSRQKITLPWRKS